MKCILLIAAVFFLVQSASGARNDETTSSIRVSESTNDQQASIDAILALAKASLAQVQADKVEVLKNAATLLSAFKGNEEQIDAALEELLATTHEAIEESGRTLDCNVSNPEDFFLKYADRHARRLEEIVHDYDCMEREFDVSERDFNATEAALVFNKCRLLVLRNVFSKDIMTKYRTKYEDYVFAIHKGKIDRFNTKTTDSKARDIVQNRGRKRHDIILPQWLGGKEFTHNENIIKIMSHEKVLGPDMILNQVGSVISESGAPTMHWHEDLGNIWGSNFFEVSGIGGHDLPPYVVSMFVPLMDNVSYAHGPTEYCMGSSHMDGIPENPSVMNKTLIEEGSIFQKMQELKNTYSACPPEHWRVPLVEMGDAVIFDYTISHRGGPNESPESRALIYALYSRTWFRDSNFDNTYKYSKDKDEDRSDDDDDEWSAGMRYTIIKESDVKHAPQASATVASLHNFAGIVPDEQEPGTVEFTFTNNNVDGAFLSVDGGPREEIPPKEQWFLAVEVGEELTAHDKDGNLLKSWVISDDQKEIVLIQRN